MNNCPECGGSVRQLQNAFYCLDCEWDDLPTVVSKSDACSVRVVGEPHIVNVEDQIRIPLYDGMGGLTEIQMSREEYEAFRRNPSYIDQIPECERYEDGYTLLVGRSSERSGPGIHGVRHPEPISLDEINAHYANETPEPQYYFPTERPPAPEQELLSPSEYRIDAPEMQYLIETIRTLQERMEQIFRNTTSVEVETLFLNNAGAMYECEREDGESNDDYRRRILDAIGVNHR